MLLVPMAITTLIVIARLVYKQFYSFDRRLDTQDWIVSIAGLLGLACAGMTIGGLSANGLGVDVWGVPPGQLRYFGIYFYLVQIFYVVVLFLIKLSLCLFFLKVFSGTCTRHLLWATVAFHVAAGLAFSIGIVFQCLPISVQWERYNFANYAIDDGHCADVNAAGWANAAFNIATDLWLLGIPLYQVRKLQLHWKRQFSVMFMFGIGIW